MRSIAHSCGCGSLTFTIISLEAKISVELTHPNVVQIYDFGKIRENYFIAMECVEGKDVKGIHAMLAKAKELEARNKASKADKGKE